MKTIDTVNGMDNVINLYPSKRGQKVIGSQLQTLNSYDFWITRLVNLDTSLFQWNNLPLTMDERMIELWLCYKGVVLMFHEKYADCDCCLPVNLMGDFNIYGTPYTRFAYSTSNGYYAKYTPYDSVIVRNNNLSMPHYSFLCQYALRLANIDRTIDINVHSQRTPILIKTTKEQEQTMRNVYKQYDDFMPVIYGDDDLAEFSTLQVLKTDSPYMADKLTVLQHNIFNEALSFMGYDNINAEKKERMISSEVSGNNGIIVGQENERLLTRKKACSEFNSLMGTNISVEINPNIVAASNVLYNAYSSQWRADPTLYSYRERGESSTINNSLGGD